ncbi:outer membrane beta-barrel domain-containing protein [Sinobacterium norvegicum]|nr:outer membrane beta-barrel domain-containing protein [Sinobacterium norvegicum]
MSSLMLTSCLLSFTATADSQAISNDSVTIIEPKSQHTKTQRIGYKRHDIEIGINAGALSVEDFGSSYNYGLQLNYFISDRLFAQLAYTTGNIEKAEFEKNSGSSFIKSGERTFSQTNLLAGYNILPGRSYMGGHKFTSGIFLLAGASNINFAGDSNVGAIVGASYRLLLSPSLAGSIDFKDIIFQRDFLNDQKITNNLEASVTLNYRF